ncbi:MAG: arginine N-succinyltransferase [Gammaproteobacteria bacterium]|nr:arginine N-succinyltransferase [Gammaproteobacteria bacterium]
MERVQSREAEPKRLGWLQLTLIILFAMVVTAGATLWLVKTYLFPTQFTPVALSSEEQRTLTTKLERLEISTPAGAGQSGEALQPQAYSEAGASRDIRFSERELNSLLAKNTDLARKVAIDLSDDLISARLLLPMDPDFPVFGGKTLRARAGVEFAYENERPIVKLRGVTIMGVPIPNAWLGGLKNVDLVSEFGNDAGFWKAFADGVAAVKVEEGALMLQLKE